MFRITASEEECLKAIYTLDPARAGTRVADVAKALSVSHAGAFHMVRHLEKEGLAEQVGQGRVTFTDSGRRLARDVKSTYEIIRLYFVEILQVDFKTAAKEAARLEHSLSEKSLAAMKNAVAHNDDWGELAQLVSA